MKGSPPDARVFFRLTFLLSTPLYILIAITSLLGKPELGALFITLLMLIPASSASLLTGRDGLRGLFTQSLSFRRDKYAWYIFAMLLGPVHQFLSYKATELLLQKTDKEIPPPMVPPGLLTMAAAILYVGIMATGEEVGWMGYAFPMMQEKRGALQAAFVLGILWASWHVPFLVFVFPKPISLTVPYQVLTLVANRVVAVWIYNHTEGNVLAVILYHAADNAAMMTLPDSKQIVPWGHVVLSLLAVATAIPVVLFFWGDRHQQKHD